MLGLSLSDVACFAKLAGLRAAPLLISAHCEGLSHKSDRVMNWLSSPAMGEGGEGRGEGVALGWKG